MYTKDFWASDNKDHITNEKVKSRIRQVIRNHDDFFTIVKTRKLKWYGHVTRSHGLANTFLQGTVHGVRRKGRRRKRWGDNISECTGLKLSDALREAENRENMEEAG
ncbi:UDP-glucuronosyltransferase 2a1-like [Plakobranchus ocellatus]|uniref:UDP-glucuronosyltransferase 2a1-like n=1 Tax=Plakobranchus ocellatus TaxID=259542 RepID=A0AAV4CKY7_9GAST|nr:UDP-glucuronosyltransferase 2a1-like [Plakobranchus ocellatus]